MKKTFLCTLAILGFASALQAQLLYSISGASYTQNFNTLIQTGSGTATGRGPHAFTSSNFGDLTGWYFSNPNGSSSNTEWRAQDGSLSGSSGRGVVSFGLADDSDRAVGTLATSNQISRFGLVLQNTTGLTLTEFSLSFDGEYWRNGGESVTNILAFSYSVFASSPSIDTGTFTNVSGLDYTVAATGSAGAVNGNLNGTTLGETVSGITWGAGEYLVLRWTGQDVTGQDNGLAIDNLAFSASPIPEPGTWALLGLGLMAVLFRLKYVRSKA